jgi:Protein of unknown function (DUF3754)
MAEQSQRRLRSETGEHFIPFRQADVVDMCADDLPVAERESFRTFTRMLASLLHHRFRDRIEALKDAYHPFNPEADTRTVVELTPEQRKAARHRLEAELTALAEAANFIPVDLDELHQAMDEHSLLKVGLALDMDVIEKVMLFRRGESSHTRSIPIWYGLRKRPVTFTNYARVLVYAVFKDEEHFADQNKERLPFRPGSMIVKLFQNVPRHDLEMVFPNVQVKMRPLDKLLIGVPAVISGIVVIATKLVASVGLLLLVAAYWLGLRDKEEHISQTALVSLGAGLAAFGGYLWRQFTKFKNRKILFMKALSENLYFRNLDNDAGVFHHLLDAAEEAEVKEAVLAYHFIRTAPGPLAPAELDRRIEKWFVDRWDARFDFEIEDGLRKLREFALVTEDGDGRLRAIPLAEARRRMDEVWDGLFDGSTLVDSAP